MVEVLKATTNPFRGIVPDPAALPENPQAFRQRLHHSLQIWQHDGALVVWLEIPINRATLIPIAVEAGFAFHHADEHYLMLTHRLMPNAFVPPYATHYIGAGGVVINETQELLVVSEKYRRRRGPAYKLPGGALHPGEHLAKAVVREVLEETGVRTQFQALACFRHWHGYRHGKSDIYFVCRLKPLSQDISMQTEEIAECLWMPVNAFLNDADVSPFNKRIVRAAIEGRGLAPSQVDGFPDDGSREFFMPH
jgi:8-oxo-dGTP pyrophosphatase MutT (NUDIX family)